MWVQASSASVLLNPLYTLVIFMVAMNAFHGWEELRSKWGRKMVGVIRYESIEARGDGQAAGSPMGLIHFVSEYGLSNHYDALTLDLARQIIGCNPRLGLTVLQKNVVGALEPAQELCRRCIDSAAAFVLVCRRVLPELGLFLLALAFLIVTFASSISALEHSSGDFGNIPQGALSLLEIGLGMYPTSLYESVEAEPMLMVAVSCFIVIAIIFLLSLIVAQLNGAYMAVYTNMLGYARLNRGKVIYQTVAHVSSNHWSRFLAGLSLDQRLEFNEAYSQYNKPFTNKQDLEKQLLVVLLFLIVFQLVVSILFAVAWLSTFFPVVVG
ncbi:unnamed protein product [Polarella glacialis]|uniref:Ion transport domain-containing protein n=1 Tax=Polarella glacialis TaxID=89957 RepID=A0A813JSJ6_POLGL|nr:unnamed protein product [Polarella glacialis]